MSARKGWGISLLGALALAALATACAGARTEGAPASARAPAAPHPAVDADLDTCAACHAQVTPAVAAQWEGGKHGLALVKCVVCHGSTGADFAARPQARACASCHALETSTMALGRCFECHPPHALRPDAKYGSPHGPPLR
jgi:hypothetical protein